MNNNHRLMLLALIALPLTACAGMTAAETTGVAVAGISAFAGFIEALAPMLSPEETARLQALAGHADSVVTAAQTAVGTLAQSLADLKAQQAAEAAQGFTDGEKASMIAGVTAGGVGISRYLSKLKHKPAA